MGSVGPPKKTGASKSKSKSSKKSFSKPSSSASRISKPSSKSGGKPNPRPKSTEQKTKRPTLQAKILPPSKRYSESQLDIPTLNGIIPANAKGPSGAKPKGGLGKVKNKVFVDDAEHMLAILGAVQAEAEGLTEGKMIKARRLEELREEKRVEAERRKDGKRKELEHVMDEVKKDRKRKRAGRNGKVQEETDVVEKKQRKKVSFA
jgi:60S ribosomal subunit assembly/export protein LOC1